NQDASEAVWERVTGRKIVYPEPRYDDVVVMNPINYAWVDQPDQPGVATKLLGTFTERETEIKFIRIKAGSSYQAGVHPAPELLFLAKGSINYKGKTYAKHSAFGFDASEGATLLKAVEEAEFFCVHLPKF